MRGIRTDGPMAPDVPLHKQRPAEYVFSQHVEKALVEIKQRKNQPEVADAAD
jgi:hypothetical protein